MLEKLDPNIINYYKLSLKELDEIKKLNYKPKLLLHVCCGPCSMWPLTFLHDYFDITIYYANSNIYPQSEYEKRVYELNNKVIPYFKDINIIYPLYDNVEYTKKLLPYKDEPECGKRCWLCYQLRLEETFKYAYENNYEYVSTVLTISRQKNSQAINQVAKLVADKYPTIKYFYSDYKKMHGLEIGTKLAKDLGMYQQDYCGCVFSYNQRNQRIANKEKQDGKTG